MKMVREKYNYTGITGVFKVLSGGNTSEFVICQGFNEFGKLENFKEQTNHYKSFTMKCLDGEHIEKIQEPTMSFEMYSRTTERMTFMEELSTKL